MLVTTRVLPARHTVVIGRPLRSARFVRRESANVRTAGDSPIGRSLTAGHDRI